MEEKNAEQSDFFLTETKRTCKRAQYTKRQKIISEKIFSLFKRTRIKRVSLCPLKISMDTVKPLTLLISCRLHRLISLFFSSQPNSETLYFNSLFCDHVRKIKHAQPIERNLSQITAR